MIRRGAGSGRRLPPRRRPLDGVGELPRVGGKRRRKILYAKIRAELLVKILDAKRITGEFLEYWVTETLPGTLSANALQGYRYIVRRDLQPQVGHTPLAHLGPEHVHVMMRALEARGLAPRTVQYARAMLPGLAAPCAATWWPATPRRSSTRHGCRVVRPST